MTNNGREK